MLVHLVIWHVALVENIENRGPKDDEYVEERFIHASFMFSIMDSNLPIKEEVGTTSLR